MKMKAAAAGGAAKAGKASTTGRTATTAKSAKTAKSSEIVKAGRATKTAKAAKTAEAAKTASTEKPAKAGKSAGAPPKDVDSYLASVPADAVEPLRALRKAIREAAPDAEEIISYGVPTYRHRGVLVSFSATSRHCAFYVMSPGPIVALADALASYDTAPTAIRFQATQPLPAALVKAIVKARIRENEARA